MNEFYLDNRSIQRHHGQGVYVQTLPDQNLGPKKIRDTTCQEQYRSKIDVYSFLFMELKKGEGQKIVLLQRRHRPSLYSRAVCDHIDRHTHI